MYCHNPSTTWTKGGTNYSENKTTLSYEPFMPRFVNDIVASDPKFYKYHVYTHVYLYIGLWYYCFMSSVDMPPINITDGSNNREWFHEYFNFTV